MARYIDADKLNLDEEVELADDRKTAHEIANIVKYAPTEDVALVKRAYWKEEPSYMEEDGSVEYHITCSNCNELYTIMGWQKGDYKYCPYCGAKMCGEENE